MLFSRSFKGAANFHLPITLEQDLHVIIYVQGQNSFSFIRAQAGWYMCVCVEREWNGERWRKEGIGGGRGFFVACLINTQR